MPRANRPKLPQSDQLSEDAPRADYKWAIRYINKGKPPRPGNVFLSVITWRAGRQWSVVIEIPKGLKRDQKELVAKRVRDKMWKDMKIAEQPGGYKIERQMLYKKYDETRRKK